MKKLFALVLSAFMLLSLPACSEAAGSWKTAEHTNRFGRSIDGQWYIYRNLNGQFSSCTENRSPLSVLFIYDFQEHISIFLYKYETIQLKNSSDENPVQYDITIRSSGAGEQTLVGTMYCGESRIFIDKSGSDIIIAELLANDNVEFHIEQSDRASINYTFTVVSAGFAKAYNDAPTQ
ncbi:MAG: hypothetical protein ACOX81_04835 [Candidatus Heteroscillospira sp.]|jgi:hypothetical protein